jgi:hypothetical protein
MKRWALLVAALYCLILVALTAPFLLLTFYGSAYGSNGLLAAVAEAAVVFAFWPYWIWVATMVTCQLALLSVPVRVARRRPVTQSALWPTILVGGLMAGVLVGAAYFAIDEFMYQGMAGGWISTTGIVMGLATWGVWTVVFRRAATTEAPADIVTRQCRLLFRGSILELLIAVPTHIVARHRDYCCAGFMTFIGLTMGVAVMLFAFGPALFYLFAERWRRLHPERAGSSQ